MGNIATPLAVAEAKGRVQVNPDRYKNRVDPDVVPLGLALDGTDPEIASWYNHIRNTASWLCESDRAVVMAYSIYACQLHKATVNPSHDEKGNIIMPLSDKDLTHFTRLAKLLGLTPSTRQSVHLSRQEDQKQDDGMF